MAKMRADGCLEVAALSRTVSGSMRSTVHGLASGACSGTAGFGKIYSIWQSSDSGTFTEGVPPRRQTMM